VVLVARGFFNHFLTGDVDKEGNQKTPWWEETELRTFRFVEDGEEADPAFYGGGRTVDGEDAAMIRETEESLKRMGDKTAKGKAEGVKNVNNPQERRESLANYEVNSEIEVAA